MVTERERIPPEFFSFIFAYRDFAASYKIGSNEPEHTKINMRREITRKHAHKHTHMHMNEDEDRGVPLDAIEGNHNTETLQRNHHLHAKQPSMSWRTGAKAEQRVSSALSKGLTPPRGHCRHEARRMNLRGVSAKAIERHCETEILPDFTNLDHQKLCHRDGQT
jgi:hypothetical protein